MNFKLCNIHAVAKMSAVIGAVVSAGFAVYMAYLTTSTRLGMVGNDQIQSLLIVAARLDTLVHVVTQAALGGLVGLFFGLLLEIGLGMYFPGENAQNCTNKTPPADKPVRVDRHRMH